MGARLGWAAARVIFNNVVIVEMNDDVRTNSILSDHLPQGRRNRAATTPCACAWEERPIQADVSRRTRRSLVVDVIAIDERMRNVGAGFLGRGGSMASQ